MRLIKVLPRILGRTIVEIIEHEIHIFLLFNLQVIVYFSVPMHLDFYMCICLTTQSPWLRKVRNLLRNDDCMLSRLSCGWVSTKIAYITCVTSLGTSWFRFSIPTYETLLLSVCRVEGIPSCFHHGLIWNTEIIIRVPIRLGLLGVHGSLLFSGETSARLLPRAYILPHALPQIKVILCWLQYDSSLIIPLYIELGVFALSSRSPTLCSLRMIKIILCQCEPCNIFVS